MKHIALGIIGAASLVASIIFAIKEAKKNEDVSKDEPDEKENENEGKTKKAVKKFGSIIKKYHKSIILGALSISCFTGMYISKAKESAAFSTMYRTVKDEYALYQNKDEELNGKAHKEKIKRKSMCDAGKEEYGNSAVLVTGFGDTIFYDVISHQRFYCSFQRIREIQQELNNLMTRKKFIPLQELYKRAHIKMPIRQEWVATALGWNTKDGPVSFEYYPQVLKDGNKGIVLGFHVAPHYSYKEA